MSRREDAINAALDVDEKWSDTVKAAWRKAAFAHYDKMIAAMLEVDEDQWDQVIADWVDQFVVPILQGVAEPMTEEEHAVALRIQG